MQNIIVISQYEVLFVQGDFKIPEKEFGSYVKDILKLKPIKKGSIYIEQTHKTYKYSVVKYEERILKV